MQATYNRTPVHNTLVESPPLATTASPLDAWLRRAAAWLRKLAHRLDGMASAPLPDGGDWQAKVSHREDVQAWFAGLSVATRKTVCTQPKETRALLRIAHLLKYLPGESTLLDFTRRVPDWAVIHKQFAAYLLRRLVALQHQGRSPDESFVLVHQWLQRRNRCLTALPLRWCEAAGAAEDGVGEDAAGLLSDRTASPSCFQRREVSRP